MPRNKFPEETRQRILDASLDAFLSKGYEATTILDIVDATDGLTRGAFYHHFKSKEEVLDAISDRIFFENNPFEAVRGEKGLTGLEKLQKAVFISVDFTRMDEAHKKLMVETANLLKSPHFLLSQFDFNRKVTKDYVQPLIEEGMKDGSIAHNNPKLLAELTLLMMSTWTNPNLFPSTPEEFIEKLVFMHDLFEGIGFPLFDGDEALAAGKQLAEMQFPEDNVEVMIAEHEEFNA
jgi:AcrR family transcriptional regulator